MDRGVKRKTSTERVREWRKRRRNNMPAPRLPTNDDEPSTSTAHHQQHTGTVIEQVTEQIDEPVPGPVIIKTYTDFALHHKARETFKKQFTNNEFGYVCSVCDRYWFQQDLKTLNSNSRQILSSHISLNNNNNILACQTCRFSLNKNKIPNFSKFNGFSYPPMPENLPKLDIVSERLISPRLPFMQIRRLRHAHGQFGILGQVINVPVEVNNMVHLLPRNLNDDFCINVHIKRKSHHKSSYLAGLVNVKNIKLWLEFLLPTPLYRTYDIQIDSTFFQNNFQSAATDNSEEIPIEESLVGQQQTLLWNEDHYLQLAPGERNNPISLLFDEHAEELSFPFIYLGQFRQFKEEVKVTPFMIASSEIRRSDRRGVTPEHLLYLAMKIMRLRVRDCLTIAFKNIGNNASVTRKDIESEGFINNCLEQNLAFLRSIPNSTWYWSQRKRDLFAMIRQLGKPSIFLTMSANEIGWPSLLKILYKMKNNGAFISEEDALSLDFISKSTLINEDAVTCAIYFNKLINILLNILQSKTHSPFGNFFVTHYFKRIEFQHRGSPHAHILLWLNDAPKDCMTVDMQRTISLIDKLISVDENEASGNIKLQKHKHTFTCFKKSVSRQAQNCRFDYPYMPSKFTVILTPMEKDNSLFTQYKELYKLIKFKLGNENYSNFDTFYKENNIASDEMYLNIIRAGINRPRVFIKRNLSQIWHNNFNPFIFNLLKSNMDIQFVLEEYSCAAYIAEYINKTTRGISNLQRQIISLIEEHPEFTFIEITRKMGVELLNTVEISSQEAAWYLLREPMSKSSDVIIYIATVWPIERKRVRKTHKELDEQEIGEDSTEIWKHDIFINYEERPLDLSNISLAQFAAFYTLRKKEYFRRGNPRIIRYRNYDMSNNLNEFKREMVTLYFPFRNEEHEILSEQKYIQIYNENEQAILENRKEFESYLDINKTIQICKDMCREDEQIVEHIPTRFPEADPFQNIASSSTGNNDDIRMASMNQLGAIVKKKENVLLHSEFCKLMRMTNAKQKALLLHVIFHLLSPDQNTIQLFLTGPAGCGKTFVINLLKEIYNRFCQTDGFFNAYITCASTGKAAVAIDGTTVHTAFKLSLSKPQPLTFEVIQQYRCLFRYVKVIIIDEISMIGAELLSHIDTRLKQIMGNNLMFGGMDIFFIGDLRQLPPVRATPIYKQLKTTNVLAGTSIWRSLMYYTLDEVMRQSNIVFSSILNKIGNGEILNSDDLNVLESRFFSKNEAQQLCPDGIRLFLENNSVSEYNNNILNATENKTLSVAKEIFTGCPSRQEESRFRQNFHSKSLIDTGGIPYEIILVLNKYYLITTNIDVSDGLANGAIGQLIHVESNQDEEVIRIWLQFPDAPKVGLKARTKAAAHIRANNLSNVAVPILRRTVTTPLNRNKTVFAKRNNFPVVSACALTIHKSQGGTFNEIVYEYHKNHSQQLLYVALSRVTTLEGLYITTKTNDKTFYHGRKTPTGMKDLKLEFNRLAENSLCTVYQDILKRVDESHITFYTLNCQSLNAHVLDLEDEVVYKSTFLLLTETWLENNVFAEIANFKPIIQYKRENIRAGGVAIYHSTLNQSQTMTPLEISSLNSAIGDMSIAQMTDCNIGIVIIVVVYISPNNTAQRIFDFLFENLLKYSIQGSRLLNKNYHELPLLLVGDFNINFNENNSKVLLQSLDENFNLKINNCLSHSTSRNGTTIDAIFSRYLQLESKVYISHFSTHKPILSFLNL